MPCYGMGLKDYLAFVRIILILSQYTQRYVHDWYHIIVKSYDRAFHVRLHEIPLLHTFSIIQRSGHLQINFTGHISMVEDILFG